MLDITRRQTHSTIREVPRIVRAKAHSRSYRLQRMPSSMTTGTTTVKSVTVDMFHRTRPLEIARNAPAPNTDQPMTRFFLSCLQRTDRTAPTARTTAPAAMRYFR